MDYLKYIVMYPNEFIRRLQRAWQIFMSQELEKNKISGQSPVRSAKSDDQTTNLEIDIYYT
jgi:hypothetical protein